MLAGCDVLAGAQTGTGKTAGFVLPMLQRLAASPTRSQRRAPRALILAPTRELAAQVEASVRTYGRHTRIASAAIFGGVGFGGQAAQLRRGVDILVATPGRLLDHHSQGTVDFSQVEIFVLDEADRMLDMGFIPDVRRVIALLPKRRQNLLFSATFSDAIRTLAHGMLHEPRTIDVAPRNTTVERIAQRVHPVDRERKSALLAYLIGHHRWSQVLVFTRTKHGADKLANALEASGLRSVALHGNKSQGARTKALADFKRGSVRVLVATDIAARGIDIVDLPHVVNYDLPNVPEDYVHRIGRTGRAGADGEAISLVCIDEHAFLRDIEKLLGRSLPRETVPGFEPDPRAVAQPVFKQRGRPGGRPGAAREPARAPRGGGSGASKPRDGLPRDTHSRDALPRDKHSRGLPREASSRTGPGFGRPQAGHARPKAQRQPRG